MTTVEKAAWLSRNRSHRTGPDPIGRCVTCLQPQRRLHTNRIKNQRKKSKSNPIILTTGLDSNGQNRWFYWNTPLQSKRRPLLHVRYHIVCMVWQGMVYYSMVWCGMVRHGMVWYGMVIYGNVHTCSPSGVFCCTSALNRSPQDTCTELDLFTTSAQMVPLPDAGPPMTKITRNVVKSFQPSIWSGDGDNQIHNGTDGD